MSDDTTESWHRSRLGDFARVVHGWPFRSEHYAADGGELPVVVSIGNFDYSGGFRFDSTARKRYMGDYPSEYELAAGDLLLVMTCQTEGGEILGVPARVPDDGLVYLHNQRIGRLDIHQRDALDPAFAFQLARTPDFNRQLFVTASGSKILHTAPSRIEAVEFDRPPIAEQRGIAEVLGALDDKIAANTRLGNTAIELAGARYDAAVRDLPVQPMSAVLRPVLGGTPSRLRDDYWTSGDRPWASAKDVTVAQFGVVIDTVEQITALAVSETKAKPLPIGGVILTARGTVGAVARVAVPVSFNQSCYGFAPGEIPAACLYFAIRGAADGARAMAHGSVFDTITMRTFDHLNVPAMEGTDWQKLERDLSQLLGATDARAVESRALAETRDVLLPQLMSGKIRVKDAERVVEGVV